MTTQNKDTRQTNATRHRSRDDPKNNTYDGGGALYGGSIPSTSDGLRVNVVTNPPLQVTTYTWHVSGAVSPGYTPPAASATANSWDLGDVLPQTNDLTISCDLTLVGGQTITISRVFRTGIRTDDAIMVGWIDASLVTLPAAGVNPNLTALFLPTGGATLGATPFLIRLNAGNIDADGLIRRPTDRKYMLNWMFKFASNSDPRTTIGDFTSSGIIDYNKVDSFEANKTQYKLFNHLQIKYTAKNGVFDKVFYLHPKFNGVSFLTLPGVGSTKNPTGGTPDVLPGQVGFANKGPIITAGTCVSQSNDGSPDTIAVNAFNVLRSQVSSNPLNPPFVPNVFWESIGSKIAFTLGSTAPVVYYQDYPTYYYYLNGVQVNTFAQAADPSLNFFTNPYPGGTVPTTFLVNPTLPGGRNGDCSSAPDISARKPPYSIPGP